MWQSPLRADHADEPCDGRQSDQREPLGYVVYPARQQVIGLRAIGSSIFHLLKLVAATVSITLKVVETVSTQVLSGIDNVWAADLRRHFS